MGVSPSSPRWEVPTIDPYACPAGGVPLRVSMSDTYDVPMVALLAGRGALWAVLDTGNPLTVLSSTATPVAHGGVYAGELPEPPYDTAEVGFVSQSSTVCRVYDRLQLLAPSQESEDTAAASLDLGTRALGVSVGVTSQEPQLSSFGCAPAVSSSGAVVSTLWRGLQAARHKLPWSLTVHLPVGRCPYGVRASVGAPSLPAACVHSPSVTVPLVTSLRAGADALTQCSTPFVLLDAHGGSIVDAAGETLSTVPPCRVMVDTGSTCCSFPASVLHRVRKSARPAAGLHLCIGTSPEDGKPVHLSLHPDAVAAALKDASPAPSSVCDMVGGGVPLVVLGAAACKGVWMAVTLQESPTPDSPAEACEDSDTPSNRAHLSWGVCTHCTHA